MRRLIPILCLFSAIGTAPVSARPDDESGRARRLAEAVPQAVPRELAPSAALNDKSMSMSMSASEAARQVQRRHGGRVLAVQSDGAGYRVKVLKDGEVRIYQVNP